MDDISVCLWLFNVSATSFNDFSETIKNNNLTRNILLREDMNNQLGAKF